MNRRLKQFIYGLFYLALLSFIFWSFYLSFLKPGPNCFDKKQNQNEEGLDCGGVCKNLCFPKDFKDLEITQEKIFRLDSNHVSFFAEVKNPNPEFAVKNFSYVLNIYNSKDEIIKTLKDNSFVFSNDLSHILIPNFEISSNLVDRLELIIEKNINWVKKENFEKPNFSKSSLKIEKESNRIKFSGSLSNQTPFSFKDPQVLVILYNQFNNPIGSSLTVLDELSANASIPFAVYHPLISDANLDATKVFVSVLPVK